MSFHPLVAEAERLLDVDHLDPEDVIELARRVRAAPPTDKVIGRTLLAHVETLTARVSSELEILKNALKQASASKKALSGYGFVKATKRNQRANKLA